MNNTQSRIPEKRLNSDVTGDDEEEIMALLDEIEQMPKTSLRPSQKTQALPSSIADTISCGSPLVNEIRGPVTFINTPNHDQLTGSLPYPFFPESFEISQWMQNMGEIQRDAASNHRLTANRENISRIKMLPFSYDTRIPFLITMISVQLINAGDIGVTLMDETGTITATISGKIFTKYRVRPHFGMTLVLRDVIVYAATPDSEKHLLINESNIVRLYSNIHHIQ